MPTLRKSERGPRSSHAWRVGFFALSVALLLAFISFSAAPPARAAGLSPIGWTTSYYVDAAQASKGDLRTVFAQWATAEATSDNQVATAHGGCTNGEYTVYVVIDFGQPTSSNILTWGAGPQTWSQAVQITLAYANAWYNASYNCFRMHLVLGVNNDVCFHWATYPNTDPCVPAAGQQMAQSVESANGSLASAGESWQVDISGGIDIESDGVNSQGQGFGSYSTSLGFVNAYTAALKNYTTKYQLYDFGDASHACQLDWGCDPTGLIYNIAWNVGYDYPFPEAYSAGQNTQWQEVSRYSSRNPIQYRVTMLDASQGNSADYAEWQDFLNKNGAWTEGGVLAGSAQLPLG